MRKYKGTGSTTAEAWQASGTGSTECTETTTIETITTTTTISEYTLATYKYDTLGRRYEKKHLSQKTFSKKLLTNLFS